MVRLNVTERTGERIQSVENCYKIKEKVTEAKDSSAAAKLITRALRMARLNVTERKNPKCRKLSKNRKVTEAKSTFGKYNLILRGILLDMIFFLIYFLYSHRPSWV